MVEDKYVNTSAMPWREFGPGIDFKVLRTSQETGWSPGLPVQRAVVFTAFVLIAVLGVLENQFRARPLVQAPGLTLRPVCNNLPPLACPGGLDDCTEMISFVSESC